MPGELAAKNMRALKSLPNGQSGRKPSWQWSDISGDQDQQKKVERETIMPRNPDGTYRPTYNSNQNYNNSMELDATRQLPRFNLSGEGFQRKIRERLFLKCAQRGHLGRNCPRKDGPKPFNAQARSWQSIKKPAP